MNTIKAVLINDDLSESTILTQILETNCPRVAIAGTANTFSRGISLINEKRPDLIFLEVMLGKNTGFDILEKISYQEAKVVFLSDSKEFAYQAFQNNAAGYLLKPIAVAEVKKAVDKANNLIFNEHDVHIQSANRALLKGDTDRNVLDFVTIFSLKKIELVKFKDLVYLKSDGRYTIFYLADGQQIVSSVSLGDYVDTLERNSFFRIHKSYIVNLAFIKLIDKSEGANCILRNGISLPLARRRLEDFIAYLKRK